MMALRRDGETRVGPAQGIYVEMEGITEVIYVYNYKNY